MVNFGKNSTLTADPDSGDTTQAIATCDFVKGQGYLTSTAAASTYLTSTAAASTYLTSTAAASTYLTYGDGWEGSYRNFTMRNENGAVWCTVDTGLNHRINLGSMNYYSDERIKKISETQK